MVAVQIRDVSPEVRQALATEARARGISLQAYLHEVLEREARSAHNREFLRTFHPIRGTTGSEPADVPGVIEQVRSERDRDVLDALTHRSA